MKKWLLLFLLIPTLAFGADQWDKTQLDGSISISDIDVYNQTNNAAQDRLFSNYRQGAKLIFNSTASVTVGAGEVVCSNSGGTTRRYRANTSSTNSVWTVGDGGLDTGSEASSTTYYVYAACDDDETGFDIVLSTNSSAPSGYTYYKRLGSFTNDGSSNITVVANDNETVVASFGTASNGATISLPSGWSTDECVFMPSVNTQDCFTNSGGIASDVEATYSINQSTRVLTSQCRVRGNDGTATSYIDNTANYLVVCTR